MNAVDGGIVLRYGDGIDSCDVYGAREAIVNKAKEFIICFMMVPVKTAGWPDLQK